MDAQGDLLVDQCNQFLLYVDSSAALCLVH